MSVRTVAPPFTNNNNLYLYGNRAAIVDTRISQADRKYAEGPFSRDRHVKARP